MYIFISKDLNSVCKIHLLSSKKPWQCWQTDTLLRILPCYSKKQRSGDIKALEIFRTCANRMGCVYVCVYVQHAYQSQQLFSLKWTESGLAWPYWTQGQSRSPVLWFWPYRSWSTTGRANLESRHSLQPLWPQDTQVMCVQLFLHHSWSEQSCESHLRVFTDNQHSGFIWL